MKYGFLKKEKRPFAPTHAEIAAYRCGYRLTDLSRNGVFVNGVRVKGSHSLHNGDIVRLGTEELRFEAERRSTE